MFLAFFIRLCHRYEGAAPIPTFSKTKYRSLSERVFLLESLRLKELFRKLEDHGLTNVFAAMELSERQELVLVDLDEVVLRVSERRVVEPFCQPGSLAGSSLPPGPGSPGQFRRLARQEAVSLTGDDAVDVAHSRTPRAGDGAVTESHKQGLGLPLADGDIADTTHILGVGAPVAGRDDRCSCGSRHGLNLLKCSFCANCCGRHNCSVFSHRREAKLRQGLS